MEKKDNQLENKQIEKQESDLVTKESLCAVCALFSLIALFILCTRSLIFGDIGYALHACLIGLLGYAAFPVFLATLYISVTSLIGKRFVKNRKAFSFLSAAVVCGSLLLHAITTYAWDLSGYLAKCFYVGEAFPAATVCGWLGGVFVWLFAKLTTKIGAIILLVTLTALCVYFTYFFYTKKSNNSDVQQVETINGGVEGIPTEIPLTATETNSPSFTENVQPQTPGVILETPTTYASQQPAPIEFIDNAMQRPAFTLPEDNVVEKQSMPTQSAASDAFSPFGTVENMKNKPSGDSVDAFEKSRNYLFGFSPAENYQRNLIFDANANVNKRPSQPQPQPQPIEKQGYSSYTNEYQNAINEQTPLRPQMVFTDGYTQQKPYTQEPIAPLEPLPTQPLTPQEPVSYNEPEPVREEPQSYLHVGDEFEMPPEDVDTSSRRHDYMNLFSPENPNVFGNSREDRDFAEETFARNDDNQELFQDRERSYGREETTIDSYSDRDRDSFECVERDDERLGIDVFDREDFRERTDNLYTLRSEDEEREITEGRTSFEDERAIVPSFEETDRNSRFEMSSREPVQEVIQPVKKQEPAPLPPKPRVIRPYVRVPIDDFDCRDVEPLQNPEEVEETKETIAATLEAFNVSGTSVASVTFGPTVTRYNITIPRNISPKKIVSLDQSIAISLHSSGVNVYPNYEDGVVSIEVPNKERQFVQLGCMLTGNTFLNASSSSLMFAMGKDVANRKIYGDISKMTHLLVAGSSGSGKSVFLGALIISLIYKYSPEELRLILIDPKKTEFVLYNNLPHLMINEIITDVNKSVQSLNWAIGEMNRRYSLFEQMSRSGTYVVNLDQYNAQLKKEERLPKIVIIIDELADLMLAAKKDIEDRIQNLTQKARAAGIHLVVATQRPSTDVITGVIKSNLATRIAFAVATDVDSRVILDQSGAQKLLGKGDFLYTMQGINTPVRVQSAFISAEDSQKVVNFIKANNEAYYDETATAFINNTRGGSVAGDAFGGDDVESVYIDALRYVILSESASISMIQRKCSVGYNKAGKIVEWMEEMGYISSFDGAKARKVLITKEEFESKYGSL